MRELAAVTKIDVLIKLRLSAPIEQQFALFKEDMGLFYVVEMG